VTGGSSEKKKKTSVWILPVRGPGEASLLKEFPIDVGNLEWCHGAGGLVVSASVYVDDIASETYKKNETEKKDGIMTHTVKRDAASSEKEENGGLNAVLFKRLPMREWDRWLDAKLSHPFSCQYRRLLLWKRNLVCIIGLRPMTT